MFKRLRTPGIRMCDRSTALLKVNLLTLTPKPYSIFNNRHTSRHLMTPQDEGYAMTHLYQRMSSSSYLIRSLVNHRLQLQILNGLSMCDRAGSRHTLFCVNPVFLIRFNSKPYSSIKLRLYHPTFNTPSICPSRAGPTSVCVCSSINSKNASYTSYLTS